MIFSINLSIIPLIVFLSRTNLNNPLDSPIEKHRGQRTFAIAWYVLSLMSDVDKLTTWQDCRNMVCFCILYKKPCFKGINLASVCVVLSYVKEIWLNKLIYVCRSNHLIVQFSVGRTRLKNSHRYVQHRWMYVQHHRVCTFSPIL